MAECAVPLASGKRKGEPCGKRAAPGSDTCRAHASSRSDVSVHPKKAAFLAAFGLTGVIKVGCDAAGVPRQTYYDWMGNDPAFAAKIPEAKAEAIDVLVTEAIKRATSGKSDTMLIFLLKAADPGRFNDRRLAVEHSGAVTQRQIITDPEGVAGIADELAEMRAKKAG